MIDSGSRVSNGDENFASVYSQLLEGSLRRPATAEMTVEATRSGNTLELEVLLINHSGTVLSSSNAARLNVLVWEEPSDSSAIPVVAKAGSTAINNLGDGDSRTISFDVGVSGVDSARMRWVVIADYQPFGSTKAFDTLQAVAGP